MPQGVPSECRTAPTNRRSVGASLPLSFRSRLQDADDQEKHKCQHDDANNKNTQRVAPGTKVIVVSAPVPLVGIIRVGRYRTYWRGHRPSVGSARISGSTPCRSRRRVTLDRHRQGTFTTIDVGSGGKTCTHPSKEA